MNQSRISANVIVSAIEPDGTDSAIETRSKALTALQNTNSASGTRRINRNDRSERSILAEFGF